MIKTNEIRALLNDINNDQEEKNEYGSFVDQLIY